MNCRPIYPLFVTAILIGGARQSLGDEWSPPESLDELPAVSGLPDLMTFADGTPVRSPDDWEHRRDELKAMIQYYEYGHLPPRPDRVTVEDRILGPIANCEGTEERLTLVIGTQEQLRMRIAVYKPQTDGKLPVLIREEHALGHIEEVPSILERGYLFVEFTREDLDPDAADVVGPAQAAYPDHDWGTLAVWAWGAMRVADYLERLDDVDLEQIGIVGHSRGGKMALLAGALDERFALVAPNGSGCGGAGCFRIEQKKVETLELITQPERFAYWFHPRLRWFADQEERLPIDQHFLKALVAPRALICTESTGDVWANPTGNRATSRAAQSVFDLLDVSDHNAVHFRDGQHDLTPSDWTAILDFADWHFRGQRPANEETFFQHRASD
ncbi:MAG: acetylxylan esterase [Planctomycetaceae bacterium]|nr:acetylxylan esterase [Planctomycetaceae bacterium]